MRAGPAKPAECRGEDEETINSRTSSQFDHCDTEGILLHNLGKLIPPKSKAETCNYLDLLKIDLWNEICIYNGVTREKDFAARNSQGRSARIRAMP